MEKANQEEVIQYMLQLEGFDVGVTIPRKPKGEAAEPSAPTKEVKESIGWQQMMMWMSEREEKRWQREKDGKR